MNVSSEPESEARPRPPAGRLAAFENRNFRRYYVGQTLSAMGTWSNSLAVTWLVLELTDDSQQLGVAVALQFLPLLLFGAPAGVLADRFDNRRILITTATVSGLLATSFGVIVATGHVAIGWIYVFTSAMGLVLAVERPTMQAFVYQLVGADLLPQAVAANGTINAASRLIGPAIAGALIAAFGVTVNFFVDAASYLIVIVALTGLHASELVPRSVGGRAKRGLRDGFAYVRTHGEVARPLIVMAVIGTVALNFGTTFPSMARLGFDQGAGSIGAVMSLSAIGSLLGGIYMAGVDPGPRRTFVYVLVAFSALMLMMAAAPTYWLFVVASIPVGFASTSFQTLNNMVLQRATDPPMLGRVMALHQMAWFGSTPIGALLMGWVIAVTNPRMPFVLGGAAAALSAVLVVSHRAPRRSQAQAGYS